MEKGLVVRNRSASPPSAALQLLIALAIGAAVLTAAPSSAVPILISGSGTLNLFSGPDTDGLDGAPYSFSYTIADGTTWTAIGPSFGFGAQVSSVSLILDGSPVTFNAGELPLFATNQGTPSGIAGLVDASGSNLKDFSVFGDTSVFFTSGFLTVPASITAGDPVLISQLNPSSNGYFSQIFELNGSRYNAVPSSFSIVPEPSTALLLAIGLAGICLRRGRSH